MSDQWTSEDYERRCADLPLALEATQERIDEWDEATDPHGWWHERPLLIALVNAVREHAPAADTENEP